MIIATDYNNVMTSERRSNWVRLRTLVTLRWVAVTGQIATIILATTLFGFQFDLGGFSIAIGASIIVNVITTFVYPETTRLSERGAAMMLLFDIGQLSALLYLSGGLNNPFALLILAPVSISATALRPMSAILTGTAAIIFVTFIGVFHHPLILPDGSQLLLPNIFVFGHWAAILIGVLFLGLFSWRVTSETQSMSEALLATQMALTREQKLTDLGGVVAAAAHELGTPLATIKLVSTELADELEQGDLRDDALLIREQADRCRDILRSMGQAGKDDLHMRSAPLQAVIEEAASPHMARGKSVVIELPQGMDGQQPHCFRQPEIIHGLRNLVQNAVDFAATTVWVDVMWTDKVVTIRIIDDGQGFPTSVLGRIGEPFVGRRRQERTQATRPEYDGMGLGLFIAKTLLERTGADISFANGSGRYDQHLHTGRKSGAIVELTWPRERICLAQGDEMAALGQNIQF
ncbi:sensor histidine kinase RegB [Celeribacter marinus]|uniref:histidine kinase n=1 Tax=Celeribacter marinus TaxID=1397108 RepID=A0A0P0AC65_9RHOB|nr:ActS/PrrB/RegB family redox-sensitive histidine kinase [Celeribacter marinus]ALI55682.1 sensor histidine kinase PrrB (RegB) [Celeribacter marinus]SFK26055.1 two-component system, sensor histidine kinase RegB [Celeribacter marinus]